MVKRDTPMKAKKTTHSFRASNTLWDAIVTAADKEGLSANEWLTLAANTQLREGVAGGDSVDFDEVGEIAKANAVDTLTAAIEKLQKEIVKIKKELGIPETK